ncbi:SDR family oxidoreductase [Polaribacter sp.]|uniref:SDR family oxidoreductase n=1 Tax=Polaribacter sp. TaxID=1920175 RepID=UPI004047E587
MKKVVVIGCKGMAGHVIKEFLTSTKKYDVWGIARGVTSKNNLINLDVSDTKKLEEIIIKHSFDVVINCIGLLNKTAEDNPDMAVWFNSYFPQLLASLGKKHQFKLIHISTDCVFSGKEGGYTENSFKNGIGFYAQSKALGEVINTKDLTFRTSIIGPELNRNGIGLFHWFMNQTDEIFGFTEAYWSGVTTIELAKGIDAAIKQDLTGLYQFVNNSKICKYDLVKQFNTIFKGDKTKITPKSDYKVDKSLINTRKDFNYTVPDFRVMIQDMKKWMLSHKELYAHYDY